MSFTDLFNHPDIHKEVDATSAASALHDIVNLFGDTSTPASSPDTGQFSMGQVAPVAPPSEAPPTQSGAPTSDGHASPVPEGTSISGAFGEDRGGGRTHPGIDFAVPLDTQLLAAASGRVTVASNADPGGYGLYVEIVTPDGFTLRYGHMHAANVQVGDEVRAGQVIGTSGGEQGGPTSGNSEGPHLHFEVDVNGQPVDPTPFLAGGYNLVGGPASSPHPVSADPKAIARVAMKNVVAAISGQPFTPDPAAPEDLATAKTTTSSGTGSTSDTDPNAVDAFLNATKQHESGGDYTIYNQSGQSNASGAYQFIGTTWRGMGGSTQNAAEASPAEQDAIARKMAMQLFNQFHSWRLVAIAWYGGPAVAEQVASGSDPGSPDQQGGYIDYGDTIQRMMNGGS